MGKLKTWKIQTKLLVLIFVTGVVCMMLFRFLWLQKWDVWYTLSHDLSVEGPFFKSPQNDIWTRLEAEAAKYNVPASEEDAAGQEAIAPYLSLADEYTGVYIYGLEDGLYRAGQMPSIMKENNSYATLFQMGYEWTDGVGEQSIERPIEFKNGYASVIVVFYHASSFIASYFLVCLFFCVFLFLLTILFFVSRKVKMISRLKQDILQMAAGDLQTPVFDAGEDELGILARELDHLRCALRDNIRHEQEVYQSNRELIAALSHDLRTPLTILKGYLEIIRLNQKQDMQAEYVGRCIQKTEDIKEMTDRMFEYALVYDEHARQEKDMCLINLPYSFIADHLLEHTDFLRLAGFETEFESEEGIAEDTPILAEPALIKRVCSNLFSNILKYADKKEAVVISVCLGEELKIVIKNSIRTEKSYNEEIPSGLIGIKSVCKMMDLMQGRCSIESDGNEFLAELEFQRK